MLFLYEKFERQYVQKLDEVCSEHLLLLAIHPDEFVSFGLCLVFIKFLLELIVR